MKELKSFIVLFILIPFLSSCAMTPLTNAVYYNDNKKVNELLNQGVDINDCFRYTPLMLAVLNGNIEMTNLLLNRGANVNVICRNGYTALMWAAYSGQIEIVKLLLERGADINFIYNNNIKFTALYIAIYYGHNDIIQLLVEKGAFVNTVYLKLAEENTNINNDILQMMKETYSKNILAIRYQQGLLLAVIDFEPRGLSVQDAMSLTELIRTELINTKQFTVIERSAMNEILKEQAFSLTGCTDNSCAVKVGKLLSARKMLVGNFELYNNQIFINGRIVDVEKGSAEIAHRESINSIKELDKGATNFVRNLANRINGLPVQ